MQIEKARAGGGINPEIEAEMEKAAKLFEAALLLEITGPNAEKLRLEWVEENSDNFRKLIEDHPGILDLFRENPEAAKAWVKKELSEPEVYH